MSLFGCGTVTRPGLAGCVNCQWLPFVARCTQPSFRSIRISLPLLRFTIRFLLCIIIHNNFRVRCQVRFQIEMFLSGD